MDTVQWVGFVSGIIFMYVGISLLVPPAEAESQAVKMQYPSSASKNFLNVFMTGAGRMNQQEFDKKTRKDICELWLTEYEKKDILSPDESRLVQLLRVYVRGADKTISRENELKNIVSGKTINQKDINKVKSLMIQVKRFDRKLGEAGCEIKRQSTKLKNMDKPSFFSGTNKLWSFRTNPSVSSAVASRSVTTNQKDDSCSGSEVVRKENIYASPITSVIYESTAVIYIRDIGDDSDSFDIDQRASTRLHKLSDKDMLF